jgi:hypothetical protein
VSLLRRRSSEPVGDTLLFNFSPVVYSMSISISLSISISISICKFFSFSHRRTACVRRRSAPTSDRLCAMHIGHLGTFASEYIFRYGVQVSGKRERAARDRPPSSATSLRGVDVR